MKLNQILPINFNGKLLINLLLGFIIATFIGIITVNSGAIIAAKLIGVKISVNYNGFYTGPGCKALYANLDYIDSIQKKYPDEIKSNADFPNKPEYLEELLLRKSRLINSYIVEIGSLLFPIIIGTLGMIFLFVNRRKFKESTCLNFRQWMAVFISLFWLRASIDIWTKLFQLVFKHFNYFSIDSRISYFLKMGKEGFPLIECFFGTTILIIVIFHFIPKQERFTFLLSGLIGGITGIYLWFFLIGKYILP